MRRWILRIDGVMQKYHISIESLKKLFLTNLKSPTGANVYSKIQIEEEEKDEEIITEEEEEEPQRRKRTQVVFNTDYGVSFRVVQINGSHSQDDLKRALKNWIRSNPIVKPLFKMFTKNAYIEAEETEFIDDSEDKNLIDGVLNFESNVRGNLIRGTA